MSTKPIKPREEQPDRRMKPCPFCASKAVEWVPDLWFVACRYCGATGPSHKSRSKAVTAWNRRTGK
jgi:Lar family restriction alleviation protein